jgi:hypothetical protein
MKRIALLVAVLSAAVAGSAGPQVAAAKEPAVAHSTAVLAVVGGQISQPKVVWLNPRTLEQLKRGVVRLGDAESTVLSPNGRRMAVGGSAFGVRVVDVSRMKLLSKGTGRRLGWSIDPISWPTSGRLLALEWHQRLPGNRLVVIDPVARRVLRRTPVEPLSCWEVAGRDLVAISSSPESIGPARVLVIDPNGAMRSVALDRIPAGGRMEGSEEDPTYRLASPGLAVDPVGRRAYVPGQAPLLAEIDLDSLTVTYRELASSRSLAARTKVVTGWTREAAWLGDGRIAVAGAEYDGLRSTPSGLVVIDVGSGTVRTVEPRSSVSLASRGIVLAAGGTYDGQTEVESGMGITAFAPDGEQFWHALGDQAVWWAQAAGGYAYVAGPDAYPPTVRVIDLANGAVWTARGQLPLFVTG